MKSFLVLLMILALFASVGVGQGKFRSGVFLHHSTGARIWGPNGSATSVPLQVASYNTSHALSGADAVSLTESGWPEAPWDNEWGRWHRIFNTIEGEANILPILAAHKIVMIKSCYPSSDIQSVGLPTDTLSPTLKTVCNYKWHWRRIIQVMKEHPSNFFVIWTNAPLVNTADDRAFYADKFCRWAKDTLAAGLDPVLGTFPENVYVFDFFHKLAGANGKLPLMYATSGTDSHPNAAATALVVPLLVNELFDAAIRYESRTVVAVPSAPTLASPADTVTGVATNPSLTWNASTGEATYQLQVSTASNFSSTLVNQSGIGAVTYALSGLVNNTTYYWRVNATNAGGTSGWSAVRTFTTIAAAPAAPMLASPADRAAGVPMSPSLTWSASAGAASYQVQVSTASDFTSTVVNQSGLTEPSHTAGGLASNTAHYWRVNAVNGGGTSPWSAIRSFSTRVETPNKVSLISPANGTTVSADSVRFVWRKSTPLVTEYELVLTGVAQSVHTTIDTAITVRVPSDQSNQTFSWRVQAKNMAGSGPESESWAFNKLTTSVKQFGAVPVDFQINNFPNPFNLSTTFAFSLPTKSFVSLRIFDAMGRHMSTLIAEELQAGTYAREWNAVDVPSGMYFYRLQAGARMITRRLILLK